MISLHWNYKDIFRACRLGLSAKKIWMQIIGLVAGGVGYTLLTYLAYWASGANLTAVWERFALIPLLDPYYVSANGPGASIYWWSWVIWAIGIAWFAATCLVTGAAVAKVTIEQLRGDDFFESREAFRYALGRLSVVIGTPVMPILFIVLLVIGGLILSLLGAIPEVGAIIVGLFALPTLGVSLFILYLLIIFVIALILVPAIAGATKNDAFDTLFEVFSCTNEQTWRLLWYSALLKMLSLLCGAVLLAFAYLAIKLGSGVLAVFMGGKMLAILSGGPFFLHLALPTWCPFYDLLENSGILFGAAETTAITVGQNVGAVLIGVAAYVVLIMVIAYALAVWNVGQTIIFCVLVRKKDDKNILAEKETEDLLTEEAAHSPPPQLESQPPATGDSQPQGEAKPN